VDGAGAGVGAGVAVLEGFDADTKDGGVPELVGFTVAGGGGGAAAEDARARAFAFALALDAVFVVALCGGEAGYACAQGSSVSEIVGRGGRGGTGAVAIGGA
jgi:hypothetical protein